jgi:hypothetical protein
MAEAFINQVNRAVGIVTSSSNASIGVGLTWMSGISTAHVAIHDIVDNANFIAGTKVTLVGVSSVQLDRASTNTVAATASNVSFLGPTTSYSSASATKSILIGGTFANNTANSVNLTVTVYDNTAAVESQLASKIPVPTGSSFVISDAGKTVLEGDDELRVYCDVENAIDVNLSILKGVS